jgi:alkanesulfonate monooxygenase SsuD/methylene tetrahydromethanopterin reductase-like flavin-dependent oxidoreductase (luciferase family)
MSRPVALYLQEAHPIREGVELVRQAERQGFEAVRRLLHDESVTYEGEFVSLDGVELDYVHQERRPQAGRPACSRHLRLRIPCGL